jgi:hypothetical protein
MQRVLSLAAVVALTAIAAPPVLLGQTPPLPKQSPPRAAAPIISSRQIDRYDAIRMLQQRLKENPKSLADWVILGELAHEVALDLPADLATTYYRISRNAYEQALALRPDQPGLRAAVQFARDHEAHLRGFEEARDRATRTYLEARRRDLAATQYTPSLPVYGAPPTRLATTTTTTVTPAATVTTRRQTTPPVWPPTAPADGALPDNVATIPGPNAAAAILAADPDPAITPPLRAQADTAGYGARQFFSSAIPPYQPYYTRGVPYTYQQYSTTYYRAGAANPPTPPITVQRYYQQVPPNPGP